jgi:hypothetical protein
VHELGRSTTPAGGGGGDPDGGGVPPCQGCCGLGRRRLRRRSKCGKCSVFAYNRPNLPPETVCSNEAQIGCAKTRLRQREREQAGTAKTLPSRQSFPSRRASLQRMADSCFSRAWRAPPRALHRVGRRRKSRRARRRRPGDRGKETAARALHQGERGGRGTKEKGEPGAAVDRICRGAPPYLVLDPALAPVAEEMDSSSHPTSAATDRNRGLSRRPGRSLGAGRGG